MSARPEVEVSRPEKVLFPDAGITKRDLASYYARVAEHMLPHVRGRPVAMQRFPDGIDGHGFFHKEVPGHFPEWIERVTARKEGGEITHVVIEDADTLVYLAGQACITPHVWLSRAPDLERGAPVAMPLTWDELGSAKLGPQRFGVRNAFRRLGRTGNPWAQIERHSGTLDRARSALGAG